MSTGNVAPNAGPLPILVAVTGHRDLRDEDRVGLQSRVREVITELHKELPHTPLVLLSSLAEGADQLVAGVALAMGIRLHVPLPMPKDQYLTDFSTEQTRLEFERLLGQAEEVFDVSAGGGGGESRDQLYYHAGEFVAQHGQILIALWDGTSSGKTGGTSDIVSWRLKVLPLETASHLQPPDSVRSGPIYQIVTPRAGQPVPANALGIVHLMPEGLRQDAVPLEAYRKVGREIDGFNAIALGMDAAERADVAGRSDSLLPKETAVGLSKGLEFTRHLLSTADILAVRFRRCTERTLTAVCMLVFLAVVAYEVTGHLLDHQEWGLLIYPGLLLAAFLIYRRAKKNQFQARYHDYRALAEGLRVQFFWRLAGLTHPVEEHYLRRQRRELNWVRTALRVAWSLQGGDLAAPISPEAERSRIKATVEHWIQDQQQFFARKTPLEELNEHRYRLLIRGSLALALILSVLVGVRLTLSDWFDSELKLSLPDLFGSKVKLWFEDPKHVKGLLLLCTSLPMVVAAMTHTYRRAIELKSHVKQYEIMNRLFENAKSRLANVEGGEQEVLAIIEELGKEALIENGDWVLLNRSRPLELPTGR
jgi:hypothetical protein